MRSATAACTNLQSLYFLGTYYPARLGSNPVHGSFSLFLLPQTDLPSATNLVPTGAFTTTLKKVKGTTVSHFSASYDAKAMMKRTPATFTATTKTGRVEISIKNAFAIAGCDITILMPMSRIP